MGDGHLDASEVAWGVGGVSVFIRLSRPLNAQVSESVPVQASSGRSAKGNGSGAGRAPEPPISASSRR